MPIISNSIQNNGGSSQGIRSQTRTYRSGNSTLHLREGQTLRGVISDIHGNDITLSMEDGSSFTGQLPDANHSGAAAQRDPRQVVQARYPDAAVSAALPVLGRHWCHGLCDVRHELRRYQHAARLPAGGLHHESCAQRPDDRELFDRGALGHRQASPTGRRYLPVPVRPQ